MTTIHATTQRLTTTLIFFGLTILTPIPRFTTKADFITLGQIMFAGTSAPAISDAWSFGHVPEPGR